MPPTAAHRGHGGQAGHGQLQVAHSHGEGQVMAGSRLPRAGHHVGGQHRSRAKHLALRAQSPATADGSWEARQKGGGHAACTAPPHVRTRQQGWVGAGQHLAPARAGTDRKAAAHRLAGILRMRTWVCCAKLSPVAVRGMAWHSGAGARKLPLRSLNQAPSRLASSSSRPGSRIPRPGGHVTAQPGPVRRHAKSITAPEGIAAVHSGGPSGWGGWGCDT